MATYTGRSPISIWRFSTIRSFAEAYIDPASCSIVCANFDRAFADIAQAKRIENANRARATLPALRKDERSYRSSHLREVRS